MLEFGFRSGIQPIKRFIADEKFRLMNNPPATTAFCEVHRKTFQSAFAGQFAHAKAAQEGRDLSSLLA